MNKVELYQGTNVSELHSQIAGHVENINAEIITLSCYYDGYYHNALLIYKEKNYYESTNRDK